MRSLSGWRFNQDTPPTIWDDTIQNQINAILNLSDTNQSIEAHIIAVKSYFGEGLDTTDIIKTISIFRPCWCSKKTHRHCRCYHLQLLKKASVKISSLKSVMLKKHE